MFDNNDWKELNTLLDKKANEIKVDISSNYVRNEKCAEIQGKTNERIAEEEKNSAITRAKVGIIEKFLWVIATASVGTLITGILSLVFK